MTLGFVANAIGLELVVGAVGIGLVLAGRAPPVPTLALVAAVVVARVITRHLATAQERLLEHGQACAAADRAHALTLADAKRDHALDQRVRELEGKVSRLRGEEQAQQFAKVARK